MANYNDPITKYPYYTKDFKDRNKKFKSDIDANIYKIGLSITGEFGNRVATLSAGYNGHDDKTNYFIFNRDQLEELKTMIEDTIDEIDKDWEKNQELGKLRDELESYISKGYVRRLQVIKTQTIIPNGFDNRLYTPYVIKPVFEYDIPDDDVNLGFNYIDLLYLSPDQEKFEETLHYLKCGHDELEIEFIGYNRREELRKYIMEAKDNLKNFDYKKHYSRENMPSQEDIKAVRDILKKLGMIK